MTHLKPPIKCSGALLYAKNTSRFLLLQKATGKHAGTWGLVGGTNIKDESPWQGLQREMVEEIGEVPYITKTVPIDTFVSNDAAFYFHTYLCVIETEFIPILSSEHSAWAWCSIDAAPRPLHQGLRNSFASRTIRNKLQTVLEVIELL